MGGGDPSGEYELHDERDAYLLKRGAADPQRRAAREDLSGEYELHDDRYWRHGAEAADDASGITEDESSSTDLSS